MIKIKKMNLFQITPELAEKILEWNNADKMLYNHFNATFWRKLKLYGLDKMDSDLSIFREKLKKVEDGCLKSNFKTSYCHSLQLESYRSSYRSTYNKSEFKLSPLQVKEREEWCHKARTIIAH